VNIDFATRTVNQQLKSLKIIRLGTSGSIREDISVGSILASSYGLGLDALMDYYQANLNQKTQILKEKIVEHLAIPHIDPYLTAGSETLLTQFAPDLLQGITVTAPGFYSPQGRKVRANNRFDGLIDKLSSFEYEGQKLCNLEMETAGIYALSNIFGHQAISINAILAQRKRLEFAKNPQKIIENMIKLILERI
jgi:uridine phosphorylase